MMLNHLSDPSLNPTRHGFFTREHGVSEGIYAGLNCGTGSSDDPALVQTNRDRVAEATGLAVSALLSLHQVHSANVIEITEAQWAGERPKADAMVTKTKGIGLGILTADCAPVLFSEPDAQVIGAAHAGWRGAMSGVTDNTIDAMIRLGAKRENISAVIGPCISQAAYEVGQEFFETFADENPDYTQFFINGKGDKMQFDLPSFVLHRLREAGIKSAAWVGECTYSTPKKYYSYRRTTHAGEADYGRLISVIRL
ncbi:MAG: peptidoglycan editing factor PgeF [Rhodobacteraceae bacterium]|nr:peptidoglycan editing factor PgeF [Paracoccaceae bacterium]